MRTVMVAAVVGMLGCATAQPFAPSSAQQARFDEVVRQAEAAGVPEGPREAAAMLAEAKSTWMYAQHLPKYPERARQLAAQAQHDAEAALMMAHPPAPAVALPVEPPVVAAPASPVAAEQVVAAEQPER